MSNQRFIANWHTHTFRCNHATGDAPDYCKAATDVGIKVLGFCDHMPTLDKSWARDRMDISLLPGYCQAVRDAKTQFPDLKIFLGLECEWFPHFGRAYYEDFIGKYGIEYLAGAPHVYQMDDLSWRAVWKRRTENDQKNDTIAYGKQVLRTIEAGLFTFMAHPDLFGVFCDYWSPECEAISRDIIQAAVACDLPLEMNGNGIVKPFVTDADGSSRPQYPYERFWRIAAEEGVTALVNSDAHKPEFIDLGVDDVYAMANRIGLKLHTFTDLKDGKLAI